MKDVGETSYDANVISLPSGSHLRDNEDALHLLKQCNSDTEEVRINDIACVSHVYLDTRLGKPLNPYRYRIAYALVTKLVLLFLCIIFCILVTIV